MRSKLVAANWKMNKTLDEVTHFLHAFPAMEINEFKNADVVICPPFPYLIYLKEFYSTSNVKIGAQNCSEFDSGAYTGEVSAQMLGSLSIDYCIAGHSERRRYFQENDRQLALKITSLLNHNIRPIFCCGETLTERNENRHFAVVELQIENALFHLSSVELDNIVIAYEPVWAIGTGVNATSEQAQEMHSFIRKVMNRKYGDAASEKIRILYGGSCNAQNAAELFACKDVDGGLIGGASLKPMEFFNIIKTANE